MELIILGKDSSRLTYNAMIDPALLLSLTISIPSMILGEIILNKETITKTSYTISDEEWKIVPN